MTFNTAIVKQSTFNFDEAYRNAHGVYYEFNLSAIQKKKPNCDDCFEAQVIKNTGQAQALDFKTACRYRAHKIPIPDNDCLVILKITWHDK